jgi:predicted Rossmann fold nucleotide-binding protein DprA/Smf involved in DNA uptake
MKLIIAGSRNIILEPFQVQELVSKFGLFPEQVVSGCARGVDKSGEKYAEAYGIAVAEFPADWSQGKGAGIVRNREMAKYGDALLLIWDGQSSGSKNMKQHMKNFGKPIYEHVMEPNEPDYVGYNNVFQFGKFKGQKIEDTESNYLVWCLGNLKFHNPEFKKCLEKEILKRMGYTEEVKDET